MRSWFIILGGLLLWFAHFMLLYAIGEFVGAGAAARLLVVAATLIALALAAGLGWRLIRKSSSDPFDAWRDRLGLGALGLGTIGIVWQALPVLFGN
ncbi:hypothetical protein E5675_15425 [Sphingopyxis sp. PAMC25046]|uniref:hypothetical protein n=1 Tax=Sphingopyxis sp. PAMC25046 TaxID=2565556 RepID=UPI00109E0BAB|nr:hypothetical protein [Sphingopyxis sp. PAMC25046]QCB55689.1 hypothetical protein E5675_15425 [Sphingopyxis sp. PAMC25046]